MWRTGLCVWLKSLCPFPGISLPHSSVVMSLGPCRRLLLSFSERARHICVCHSFWHAVGLTYRLPTSLLSQNVPYVKEHALCTDLETEPCSIALSCGQNSVRGHFVPWYIAGLFKLGLFSLGTTDVVLQHRKFYTFNGALKFERI
jgi:hypothetical protein